MSKKVLKVFICVLALISAAFAVNVTFTSPGNGASVGSPTTINANASSSSPITGWRIYVDNNAVYQGGASGSISATVSMGAGTHQVAVRAWDSTGAYGSYYLQLTVGAGVTGTTSGSGVAVNLASPGNGATVSSPAYFSASASSGTAITGWRIYVDGNTVYQAGSQSAISTSVSMGAGTHQVVVRAWNSSGAFGSANLTLNVGGSAPAAAPAAATTSAGPMPPSNAIVLSNLEKTSGWGSCSSPTCSGGSVAGSYYAAPYQTTPSLDGSSTRFTISGGSYADDLFWVHPAYNATPSHFIVEWNVYTDSATYNLAEALEFDFVQVANGLKYNFSSECNYAVGTWDTWNEATQRWVHSNVPCPKFTPNAWHNVKWYYERVGAQTHYISITVDGVTYPVSSAFAWQPAPATNWTNGSLIFQVQQDLNASGGSFTEWVNKANIYLW